MDNLLALVTALASVRNAVRQSDLQALRDTGVNCYLDRSNISAIIGLRG